MCYSIFDVNICNPIDETLKNGEKVSQIRVYYKEEEDQLKLVYEDDEVDIPKDEKEKIFVEGCEKGIGFGLYLIRKICENYGWTIQETGVPGKGAQFTMTIPKNKQKRRSKLHTQLGAVTSYRSAKILGDHLHAFGDGVNSLQITK